ncbi:hypothetical protein [Synechococcus sp. CS-1328]|uniref:hypothetical protein n=1 Tax=Synechococcus sp. CS-1328 TaxID=2847976 RepID=UPI00223AEAB5|nr:hypothetical protein [Synechococcus sp. CS-1328]MCT0224132.1 hypothetical protein [Synechococcus sp. CS-1328]
MAAATIVEPQAEGPIFWMLRLHEAMVTALTAMAGHATDFNLDEPAILSVPGLRSRSLSHRRIMTTNRAGPWSGGIMALEQTRLLPWLYWNRMLPGKPHESRDLKPFAPLVHLLRLDDHEPDRSEAESGAGAAGTC